MTRHWCRVSRDALLLGLARSKSLQQRWKRSRSCLCGTPLGADGRGLRCAVRCAIAAPRTFTKSSYVHSTSASSQKPRPRSALTSAQGRSSRMPVSASAKRHRALVVLPSASARLR